MRRMEFECSAENYNEQIASIDEQICALLKQRKELANNQPVFPPQEAIVDWAGKFELYESFLQTLFGVIRNDEDHRPYVEPTGFRKQMPVLKCVEKEDHFYSVTMIRQYDNASVVYLHIDGEIPMDTFQHSSYFPTFGLSVADGYDCRSIGGSGSEGHFMHRFVVSPALPDTLSGMNLVFKEEQQDFYQVEYKGLEIVIQLD